MDRSPRRLAKAPGAGILDDVRSRPVGDGLPEMQVRATCCRKMRVRIAHGETKLSANRLSRQPGFHPGFRAIRKVRCVYSIAELSAVAATGLSQLVRRCVGLR